MLITDKLNTPGEHLFSFPGEAGRLEIALTVPDQVNTHFLALLGHPHSLQGGTMNNKVVTTLVRAFKELHIPSLRFNFRGVGQSEGMYDEGIGESEDMLLLARLWKQHVPDVCFLFAGFSFGSYVAYRAASQCNHSLLITVAPPVHHYDYTEFSRRDICNDPGSRPSLHTDRRMAPGPTTEQHTDRRSGLGPTTEQHTDRRLGLGPTTEQHTDRRLGLGPTTEHPTPWVIIQGDEDEVVPLQSVLDFVTDASSAILLHRFAETGHFFHGKLVDLKACLINVIREQIKL